MDTRNTRLAAALCAVALAGCATQGFSDEELARAGAALRENVAQQTLDPTAGQRPTAATPTDATKVVKAIDRYRKDDGKVADDTLIKNVTGGGE